MNQSLVSGDNAYNTENIDNAVSKGSIATETLEYLGDAILEGDRLPNPRNIEPVKRRALIVRDYVCVLSRCVNTMTEGRASILGGS